MTCYNVVCDFKIKIKNNMWTMDECMYKVNIYVILEIS